MKNKNYWSKVTSNPKNIPVIIIRASVGAIFLSEGLQKFLFPEAVGAGRFAKIGLPSPDLLAPFVGATEILCGIMILLGILTRVAAVPLIIVMSMAITFTKVPIFVQLGFWKMAHEARTDYSMLLSLVFLLIVGSGHLSIDQKIMK